ncbi:MAG TPA: ERF family protein [Terriglobales bacterium]|nr:ERF family protein [Terriglobales bacterium]
MSEANGNGAAAAPPKSLVTKLAEVMAEVERVAKRGRNDFHKYDYVTEADIAAAVREHMAARHLMMIPSVESLAWRADGKIATLGVKFTIYDGDTGEMLPFLVYGEGQDSGDKATYKAMTGANKYALLKLFQIPTGDDPEREGGGSESRSARRERAREQAARDAAEHGPYADRERERAAKGVPLTPPPAAPVSAPVLEAPPVRTYEELMARRAKLPEDVRDCVPTDEALLNFPPPELMELVPEYIESIKRIANDRKLSSKERGDLLETFFGSRNARLDAKTNSPFFVYALYRHMRPEQA